MTTVGRSVLRKVDLQSQEFAVGSQVWTRGVPERMVIMLIMEIPVKRNENFQFFQMNSLLSPAITVEC